MAMRTCIHSQQLHIAPRPRLPLLTPQQQHLVHPVRRCRARSAAVPSIPTTAVADPTAPASASTPSPSQQQQQQANPQPEASQQQQPQQEVVPGISVRPVLDREFRQVAQLRAEAYYESDTSRFAPSFKRQFADQEVDSLGSRARPRGAAPPRCECLVALDEAGSVIGCIDIRLPHSVTGVAPSGVPAGDTGGAYLYNLVVAEEARRGGVGKQLMAAGMRAAVERWGAARLYTQVAADNEVAYGLYRSYGFSEHSVEATVAPAVTLGRLVLLMVDAQAAREQLKQRLTDAASSTAASQQQQQQPASEQ